MKKPRPPKTIGRRRRAAGWTLLTLGVIAAGLWIASGWFYVNYFNRKGRLSVNAGRLDIDISSLPKGPPKQRQKIKFGHEDGSIVHWTDQRIENARLAGERESGGLVYSTRPRTWAIHWIAKSRHRVPQTHLHSLPQRRAWSFSLISAQADVHGDSWSLVLWPIPLLLWTPAALLLRSGIVARRRVFEGMCAKCGYSLAGLGDSITCPECGKHAAVNPAPS